MGPIDIRYHIILIISIFLSLGIGILIGMNLLGTNVLIERQNNVIDRLEKNLGILNNKSKEKDIKINELKKYLAAYENEILPKTIQNILEEEKVGIVNFNEPHFPSGNLKRILKLTGLKITFTLNTSLPPLIKEDKDASQNLSEQYWTEMINLLTNIFTGKNIEDKSITINGNFEGDENYIIFNTENLNKEIENIIIPLTKTNEDWKKEFIVFSNKNYEGLLVNSDIKDIKFFIHDNTSLSDFLFVNQLTIH